jgi:hypothetical protein
MQNQPAWMRYGIAALGAWGALVSAPLRAQEASVPPAVVHVHVADTSGAPLQGATLTVLRTRQQEALYVGISNAEGRYTFSFAPESVSYQIVVRKVGYVQTARLLPLAPGDTLTLALRMARLPRELDTVRVTEELLPSKKYYHLSGDEIMRSTRPIDDAYDAARALAPVMIMGDAARLCDRVGSVWINGKRWTNPPPTKSGVNVDHTPAAHPRAPTPPPPGLPPPPSPNALGSRSVMGLLMAIRKEDIEQMTYVNRWDTSMPGIGGMDAIFVTLKPGIGFNLKYGSFVDSTVVKPPM